MMNRRILMGALLVSFLSLFLLVSSCSKDEKLKIAISKGSGSDHYKHYSEFLESSNKNIECIDLYSMEYEEALKAFESCSGLLLSGGPDVHPGRFGKEFDTARCEIDLYRDTLEFAIIKKALERKLPILAICRGEQILNVALGGSLIVDIPEDFDTSITHRCDDPATCFHDININKHSLLFKICGVRSGMVNTNHHQAVDILSEEISITARSEDDIIEAYEWKDRKNKPFMLAVQWHPERMPSESPLGMPIAKYFLEMTEKYRAEDNN